MPTVRPAVESDAEAVLDLHVASIRAFGPDAYDDEQVAAWAEKPRGAVPYREHVRDEDARFVVAEREGEVAGFGHLEPDDGEVLAVYVHPDHACAGVGTALLADLEATARNRELDALSLTASRNAVEFYERAGYEPVENVVVESTGGVELDCTRMAKTLRKSAD